MRRVKHALRWIGIGALLAYLFDPDRGRERRESALDGARHLVEQAKGTVQDVESAATDMAATVTDDETGAGMPRVASTG